MALTNKGLKEILSEAGLDAEHSAEAVRKIMEGHNATVDALKEREETAIKERDAVIKERDAYKADAEKLAEVQKELETVKGGDWENKYNKLKADTEAAAANAAKQAALDELLKGAFTPDGVKLISEYADFSAVELTKDGKVKGAEKLMEGLKEKWGMFVQTTTTQGANIPNPPTNAAPSGGDNMTLDEIYKIEDATERQKAINEHPALFGYSSP